MASGLAQVKHVLICIWSELGGVDWFQERQVL